MMRMSMADSKGIKLERKILAKLMLLEYFKTEWFKGLAELQASQNGMPKELDIMEKLLSSEKAKEKIEAQDEEEPAIPKGCEGWKNDAWMCDWLKSDPKLAKLNLHPYFYFSRDALNSFSGSVQRMSPAAQELTAKLLSDSEAVRKHAIKEGAKLNEAETTAIFESLCERAKSIESDTGGNQILDILLEWSVARGALLGQYLMFLTNFPEKGLPIGIVVKVEDATKNGPFTQSGTKLIEKWRKSASNKLLAQAAQNRTGKGHK
jgi:hypothetical protein